MECRDLAGIGITRGYPMPGAWPWGGSATILQLNSRIERPGKKSCFEMQAAGKLEEAASTQRVGAGDQWVSEDPGGGQRTVAVKSTQVLLFAICICFL